MYLRAFFCRLLRAPSTLCAPPSFPTPLHFFVGVIHYFSISLILWIKLICLSFGFIHWCFFLFLLLPSVFLSVSFSFTVYSNTAGCSEPLGMKSRLISDGQISASGSFRTWGIDTFTWHPQFARLDKQGKTNAWSPSNNNRSEWIQVR